MLFRSPQPAPVKADPDDFHKITLNEIERNRSASFADTNEEDDDLAIFDGPVKRKLLTLTIENQPGQKFEQQQHRLIRLHSMISAYPGKDAFAFVIREGGKSFLIEYPKLSIKINDDLIQKLRKELGENNVVVES